MKELGKSIHINEEWKMKEGKRKKWIKKNEEEKLIQKN